jgi:uncharacterized coiled-coil protein SlyX
MRKIVSTVALVGGLTLGLAPAAGADALPPCPTQATRETVTDACQLPAYPAEAQPVVTYLWSVINVFQAMGIDLENRTGREVSGLNERVADQASTIAAQQERIAHQRATIKRLRESLAAAHH